MGLWTERRRSATELSCDHMSCHVTESLVSSHRIQTLSGCRELLLLVELQRPMGSVRVSSAADIVRWCVLAEVV